MWSAWEKLAFFMSTLQPFISSTSYNVYSGFLLFALTHSLSRQMHFVHFFVCMSRPGEEKKWKKKKGNQNDVDEKDVKESRRFDDVCAMSQSFLLLLRSLKVETGKFFFRVCISSSTFQSVSIVPMRVRWAIKTTLFFLCRREWREKRAPWTVEGSFCRFFFFHIEFYLRPFSAEKRKKNPTNSMFFFLHLFLFLNFLLFSVCCAFCFLPVGKVPRKRVKFFLDSSLCRFFLLWIFILFIKSKKTCKCRSLWINFEVAERAL